MKVRKCQGESRVGKQDGFLQPAAKQQAVDSTGQLVVEMDKGTGKARLRQENQGLVHLPKTGLCHQGLGGDILPS